MLDRWVFHFAHLRQLPVLVPYMPIDNPRLSDTAYEVCPYNKWTSLFADTHVKLCLCNLHAGCVMQVALVALATNPSYHNVLLSTVKSWPTTVYSVLPVISAIEPQLNSFSMTDMLKEVGLFFLSFQWHCSLCLMSQLNLYSYNFGCLLQSLAELYVINTQYEKALTFYADVSS